MERPPRIERFPSKEEVLLEIGKYCKNPSIKRELSDSKGPYLLEVEEINEKTGESSEYRYQRKGNFLNMNESGVTGIYVTFLTDNEPVGGHTISTFNSETKKWEEAK